MDEEIKQSLINIVGEENYTDSLIDMVSYSYDASEHSHRPSCGVWVETTEQVSEILKLANRERIPVIPRGAGTGLSGMAVPVKGGIVLDLNRMNKILKISIEDRLAVVQPGVVYADLEKVLAPDGFFSRPTHRAEMSPLWGETWQPTPAVSREPSTAPQEIMSLGSRWSCRTDVS